MEVRPKSRFEVNAVCVFEELCMWLPDLPYALGSVILAVMRSRLYVPHSSAEAAQLLRSAHAVNWDDLTTDCFVRVWCSIAYLFPGLHPDGYNEPDSGWPKALRRFAAEAWRRAKAGELSDDELYPCDTQWCGIYDRMRFHLPDETERRLEIASHSGMTPWN